MSAVKRAVLYLRKSTKQESQDERELSTARQESDCRAYCQRKDWEVVAVYDEGSGVSGTLSEEDRPELSRLIASAQSKPRPFDYLVAWNEDRVSREGIPYLYLLHRLEGLGVRVFYADKDREAKIEEFGDIIVETVNAGRSREHARATSKDTKAGHAKRRQSIEDWCPGQAPYGYARERRGEIPGDRKSGHTVMVVDPTEAEVVRRIFAMVLAGQGLRAIADSLNREGVPSGRSKWNTSSLQNLLRRDVYRGVLYDAPRGDKDRKPIAAPNLRIISEATWTQTRARLDATRERFAKRRDAKGRLSGRAEAGLVANHLLSGFLACSCGAAMKPVFRTQGKYTYRGWQCSRYAKSGPSACQNRRAIPYDAMTEAILGHFTRETLEGALLAQPAPDPARVDLERQSVEAELVRVDEEIRNLVKAIKSGKRPSPVLAQELEQAEGNRDALRDRLSALETDEAEEVEDAIRDALADETWKPWALTGSPEDRAILKALIPARIVVTPTENGWSYEGGANLLGSLFTPSGRALERVG